MVGAQPFEKRSTRVLVTGTTGQVGGDLIPSLRKHFELLTPTRSDLDLADPDSIRRFVRHARPHWIVNPAAYTAVDKAEGEPGIAALINATAPRVFGEEAARIGAAVIHFSTDYVFDGSGHKPWKETDATGPLGVYGATKLAGEQALAATGAAHLILRTSWVFGARGKNFLRTILRFAGEREELKVVNDQFGAPTWSRDLAQLTTHILLKTEESARTTGLTRTEVIAKQGGVFHAASAGETTWFGFAQEFIRLARLAKPEQAWATLSPISTADYPTPAKRPENSRLDCSRLSQFWEYTFPSWQHSTAEVIGQLFSQSIASS